MIFRHQTWFWSSSELWASLLLNVMLMLVWLAHSRQTIWLLLSAASPKACCGCLSPGGDLISPWPRRNHSQLRRSSPPPIKIAADNYISQQTVEQSIIIATEQRRGILLAGIWQNRQWEAIQFTPPPIGDTAVEDQFHTLPSKVYNHSVKNTHPLVEKLLWSLRFPPQLQQINTLLCNTMRQIAC